MPDKELIFLDSETCGLHSMMVLFQWAEGKDGDIKLWEIWKKPVGETLDLFEWVADNIVVGFNLVFDWFHCQRIHSIWSLLPRDWVPEEHIEEIAAIEPDGRDGKCLKPYSALDLLLHSRRGPYQSLMARHEIRIKKIPLTPVKWDDQVIPMAYAVASHLERTVELDGIYFAKRADPDAPRWCVFDREDKDGKLDKEFADVVLKFNPNGSLKSLAEHALGIPPKYAHSDIELDKKYRPIELGYAPLARCISSPEKNWEVWEEGKLKGYAWPGVIQKHINHWHNNEPAREYANDDIVYTRGLYYHFDEPEHGDRDSILSCMVPSIRWHGFEVDLEGIQDLRDKAEQVVIKSPINTNRPIEIREYINAMCDDTEKTMLEETTDKPKLEEMAQLQIFEDEVCMLCLGEPDCIRCGGTGELKKGIHPCVGRVNEILGIKIAKKEIELYDKLLLAGRFHASFKITGTLSNRMAGGDGLNAQGIKKGPDVRRKFPLKWDGYELCGGDFSSFEITLADAVYNDKDLRAEIVSGRKLHGTFGVLLFPGHTYEEILNSEKNPDRYEFGDMYSKGKAAVFSMLFGGNASTIHRKQSVPEEIAEKAYNQWGIKFPGIAKSRQRIIDDFQPLLQPGGIGTNISWNEPQEYVESFLGFRRYFTLEYKIVHALFDLARHLPKEWRQCDTAVVRSAHRGVQKAWGALSSALYGAAFGIAEGVVRAAANHEIQSPGAEITKETQVAIWGLQPTGLHDFVVAPMNIHDEIMSVTHPDYIQAQADVVQETVEGYQDKVPLIGITWSLGGDNWFDTKKDDSNVVKVTYDKDEILKELQSA